MPTLIAVKFEDLVAIGLRALVADDPNLELVAADVPMDGLDAAIERHRPDVALLNYGTLGGPARVLALHRSHPDTRLVVLANHPTAAECTQMLAFGATACLSKETEARDVVSALHLASRGMHMLPRSAAVDIIRRSAVEGADLLTPREAEVADLLRNGASNAEIAHELSIGIETVRTHARAIYRKLGIGSRRELSRTLGTASAVVGDS
jgi:DNA-binding NarL/FixJ family response regulator